MDLATQKARAETFHRLHDGSDPLILFNAWDVASARAIADSASAVATGSAGVASSLGFADGENVPLDTLVGLVARMSSAIDKPLSIDLEAGYGEAPDDVARSVRRILEAGAVGINIEDGLVSGRRTLAAPDVHAEKIHAARAAAEDFGIPLFINARTDPFLLGFGTPEESLEESASRATIYADAGADGIFVPGLTDPGLLARLVEASPLPVNVMITAPSIRLSTLAAAGVRRISMGPWPMKATMTAVARTAARFIHDGEYAVLLRSDVAVP